MPTPQVTAADGDASSPDPIFVPQTLYFVAALFFAKGAAWLITAIDDAVNTRVIETGGILFGALLMLTGWGLVHFRSGWRSWAQLCLVLGTTFRLLVVVTLGVTLAADMARGISKQSASVLRQSSSGSLSFRTREFGVQRVAGSTGPAGWYINVAGKERRLGLWDATKVMLVISLAAAINLWQMHVLSQPPTRRVFNPKYHQALVGQMSLIRFLLLTTVFLSAHLVVGRLVTFLLA